MPKTQKISQRKWLRGVNAAAQAFAQPPGSFPRATDLVFNRRGALITSDGSQLISTLNGIVHPPADNIGPIIEVALYGPQGGPYTYFSLAKDFNTHLGAPTGFAAAAGAAGPLTGTYKYVITTLDGSGGESTPSTEVTVVLTAQLGSLTWTPVVGAGGGYNIYRTVAGGASGTEKFVVHVPGQASSSFTDSVSDGNLGLTTPPLTDTTQVTQFYLVPPTSYGIANVVKTFPADNLVYNPGPSGGGGGGGGSGGGGQQGGGQPAGGSSGNLSPLPQIIQFKNLMILLLGNGWPPYSSDGTTGNTIALVNNFQASYGARTASTAQNVGDQIAVNVGGTNYIFTAVQAGTTASGAGPSFPATEAAIVVDGTVYWKNSGKVAASTAPRGAAHGIVYAGSLWIGNTSPLTTADNIDGPSCLKMSDLNNPNSWNPLNVAFLDRDDGTQIQGMETFTLAESGIPPTGSLVVFKDFSTFQVNGVFGASNFSIQRAQTDMGCTAPRTIQFVPGYGIVRLSHLGFAMFDGVRDRLLSEEIRPYLFGGVPDIVPIDWGFAWFSKGAQTAIPPMYVCAVPLQGAVNPALFFGVTVGVINTFSNGLPLGTYFVVIQATMVAGQKFVSGEFSVTLVFSSHGSPAITVQIPSNPAVATWQVFITDHNGGSGNERLFVSVPNGTTTVNILGNTTLTPGTPARSLGGQLTRIFCYDLVLKAWTIVDLPFPISVMHQFRAGGTYPITVLAGFSDGGIRRWLGGAGADVQWDAGAANAGSVPAVQWAVRTPEVFGRNASDRVYFRELAIRGIGDPSSINVAVTVNGGLAVQQLTRNVTAQPMAGGEFAAYLDIGLTGVDAHATIKGSGPIEIDSVDWLAVGKQLRGKVSV